MTRFTPTPSTGAIGEISVGALERAAAMFARIVAVARGLPAAIAILVMTVVAVSPLAPARSHTHSAASLVGLPGGRADELAAFSRASDCGSDLLASSEPAPIASPSAAPLERTFLCTGCMREARETADSAPHACAQQPDVHDAGDGKRGYRLENGDVLVVDPLEPFRPAGLALEPAPAAPLDPSTNTTRIAAGVVVLLVIAFVATHVARSRRFPNGVS